MLENPLSAFSLLYILAELRVRFANSLLIVYLEVQVNDFI